MNLRQFAKKLVVDNPGLRTCYVATVVSDSGKHFNLEVETVPEAEIGGMWDTMTAGIKAAEQQKKMLTTHLQKLGVFVFTDGAAWGDSRMEDFLPLPSGGLLCCGYRYMAIRDNAGTRVVDWTEVNDVTVVKAFELAHLPIEELLNRLGRTHAENGRWP